MSLSMSGLNDLEVDTLIATEVDSELMYIDNVAISPKAISYIASLRLQYRNKLIILFSHNQRIMITRLIR